MFWTPCTKIPVYALADWEIFAYTFLFGATALFRTGGARQKFLPRGFEHLRGLDGRWTVRHPDKVAESARLP